MNTRNGTGSGNTSGRNSGKGGFDPPSTAELDAVLAAYEFIEILGRGGMGAVYKARQKSLDRLVAIKILPPSLVEEEEGDEAEAVFHFAERFQREARAMAKLTHPNIIAVYDFGQASDGQFYFVMEYVEGSDLHSIIHTGELTIDHVAGWMSQICDALHYAHAKGIVHRDIKPANIMITREGQVKVADFGLAKITGGDAVETKLTMTNMAMGTPDYVAPEVLEMDAEIDHRADLYAVGVMLYEMLTGKVPRGAWKPPSNVVPGLDARYDKLVERAMDSDRGSRFQHASEISATIYEIATTVAAPDEEDEDEKASRGQARMRVPGSEGSRGIPARGAAASQLERKSKRSPFGLVAGIAGGAVLLGLGAMFLTKKDSDEAGALPPSTLASSSATGMIAVASPTAPAPSSPAPKAQPPAAIPAPPASAAAPVGPVGPVLNPGGDRFSGIQFPRDLTDSRFTSVQFEGDKIVIADAGHSPGPPAFLVPVAATGNHELEIVYSFRGETPTPAYLKVITPVRDGWISVQVHESEVITFARGLRDAVPVEPAGDGAQRQLLVVLSDGEGGASIRVTLDGRLIHEGAAPGLDEILNFKDLSSEFILVGGGTRGGPPIDLHSIRVTPTAPGAPPAPPGGGPRPSNLLTREGDPAAWILEGITEIDFGDRVPGIIRMTGTDAMPLLVTPDGRVFGVAADPQNASLPRVVAMAHGFFLQGLQNDPGARQVFENALAWLGGEGKSTLLISPEGMPWGSKQWAVQNGYRVESRPPEGGGGVLVLAENSAYQSEENRKLIRELLPKVDGVFTALTPWANIKPEEFPQHPAGEIFAPFGFDFSYGGLGIIGKWKRPEETPPETAVAATATDPPSTESAPAAPAGPVASPSGADPPTRIAAASATDPRLAQLEQGFQAAYERDANSHFKADLATLDQGYFGALDRARAAAQSAGDLTAVTLLDEEKQRVAGGGGVPPAGEEPGDPAPLAELRGTYREAYQRLERERGSRAAPLTEKYLAALAAYESELTRSNEIEKALSVREFGGLVAARGEAWISGEDGEPGAAPEASGPPPADLRDLPRGRAKAYGKGVGGEALPVDAREHLVEFADHRDLVRVFLLPHWPHALKANGELLGYHAPAEAENRRIVAVSLGYFCAMGLRADGTVAVSSHQGKSEPPGLPLASINDAVSVASNYRAAAILRASGELVVWADASGAPARIEVADPPKGLVSLHPTASVLLARDGRGEFHAIHPAGDQAAASELNALGGVALLESSPHVEHWLALDKRGKVHAGPNRHPWTEVPDDLGKVTALRVGQKISAARLESGEWRAWGNPGGGVVEKINALGPNVHDLSMDSFDDEKTKLLWLE